MGTTKINTTCCSACDMSGEDTPGISQPGINGFSDNEAP